MRTLSFGELRQIIKVIGKMFSLARPYSCAFAAVLFAYMPPVVQAKDAVYQRAVGFVGALADSAFTTVAFGKSVSVSPMYKVCETENEYFRTVQDATRFIYITDFRDIPCRWKRKTTIGGGYISVIFDYPSKSNAFNCKKFIDLSSEYFKNIANIKNIYVIGFSENVSLWNEEKLQQVEKDSNRYFHMNLAEIFCLERNIVLRIKKRG